MRTLSESEDWNAAYEERCEHLGRLGWRELSEDGRTHSPGEPLDHAAERVALQSLDPIPEDREPVELGDRRGHATDRASCATAAVSRRRARAARYPRPKGIPATAAATSSGTKTAARFRQRCRRSTSSGRGSTL
jgi:hypothetical protein